MKHLDLFSGIGGFALSASWVWGPEHDIHSFVEIDPFCQKVLKRHWPDVPIISDIRDVTYENLATNTERFRRRQCGNTQANRNKKEATLSCKENRTESVPRIDLLTGGFPCQPFSQAGKQGGKEDDRYLWPEMLRVIREIRPTWIIGENVAGIINMELDNVLSDLEDSEYEVQPFLIPACGVDAPHRRDRVWIIAHDEHNELGQQSRPLRRSSGTAQFGGNGSDRDVADSSTSRLPESTRAGFEGLSRQTGTLQGCQSSGRNATQGAEWLPEPNVGRVAHGIPSRVDRLKGLGNAIVPQVVVPIMEAIKWNE